MKKTKDSTNKKFYSSSAINCPNCGTRMDIEKTITPKAEINEYFCSHCGYHENVIDKKLLTKEQDFINELNRYNQLAVDEAPSATQATYDTLGQTTITSTTSPWYIINGQGQINNGN